MQKSQSQQRLDRQQCITGPACQEINRTIFITAHCNFSWQWSEISQFLQQNCSQLLLSQSSWCLTEPFGKPLSLAAITACPSTLSPFSRKESHWVKLCSFLLTSHSAPQQCRWCHPRGELSKSWKVAANWEDRAGKALGSGRAQKGHQDCLMMPLLLYKENNISFLNTESLCWL